MNQTQLERVQNQETRNETNTSEINATRNETNTFGIHETLINAT